MKKVTYLLALIIIFASSLAAQERDSLIQLYPGLGDTIDHFDASYFELFKNIDGFEQAVFYIRNNQRLVSKVTYSENGISNDTTFVQPLSALDDVRKNIEEIEKENEKKYKSPREFIIETKNGTEYLCEIKMFSRDAIYFSTEETVLTSSLDNSKFKLNHSDIVRINLSGESNTWSCMGWGALIGLGIGLIGITIQETSGEGSGYAIIGVPLFAALSGLVGLIFGLVSSSDDEIFQIDHKDDVLKLKDYAKYYFRYAQSIEEQYVEVK